MLGKHCFLWRWPFSPALLATAMASTILWAQFEDEDEEDAVQVEAVFEISEDQFDRWIFSNIPSASAGRQWLESLLQRRIEYVDTICGLSEAQKNKIQLAGQGDIQRFYHRVEEVRRKFLKVRTDQKRFNEIWQEIQPLQLKIQTGIFEETSLIHKILFQTLDSEQQTRYADEERKRNRFFYEAKIELAVAMLERDVPLLENQRQQFITLLLEETEPPKKYGRFDYYIVLLKADKLPESKVKPIFDHALWQELKQQFAGARGMEHHLRRNGFIQ